MKTITMHLAIPNYGTGQKATRGQAITVAVAHIVAVCESDNRFGATITPSTGYSISVFEDYAAIAEQLRTA